MAPTLETLKRWSKMGHRTAVGEAMEYLAEQNGGVYCVTADLTPTARLEGFAARFPDKMFNVGIAEQNLIDFCAGMAREGLVPFAVTLAAFAPMRCAEQMRMALGYMNLNCKVVGVEAGVRFGPLGNTHYGMDDIAVARAIPNFTVIAPSDPLQVFKAFVAAADYPGPVYLRTTGAAGFPVLYPEDFDYKIGKAIEYRAGSDVAFIACGSVLAEAIAAAELLAAKGISARVVDMHTIKPLDTDMLNKVFAENKLVLTVEEHTVIGGLGAAVAEYGAPLGDTPRHILCGLKDSFMDTGSYEYILKGNGLTAPQLAELAEQNL